MDAHLLIPICALQSFSVNVYIWSSDWCLASHVPLPFQEHLEKAVVKVVNIPTFL